jgi:hypothetical protein
MTTPTTSTTLDNLITLDNLTTLDNLITSTIPTPPYIKTNAHPQFENQFITYIIRFFSLIS